MAKKSSQAIVFFIAMIAWLLLVFKIDLYIIILGAAFALLASLKFGELFTQLPSKALDIKRYFWFLCFIPVFIWEMIKANVDVAYRVLHPALPINPGLVKIKTKLKNDLAKTILANAITLTPGTTTVYLKDDDIYIHWLYVKTRDIKEATKLISLKYESLLARIFE